MPLDAGASFAVGVGDALEALRFALALEVVKVRLRQTGKTEVMKHGFPFWD